MNAAHTGNELVKTMLFVGAAVVCMTAAYVTRPTKGTAQVDDEVGKALFASLNEATAANGLEVVSYDEALGQVKRFQVKQQEQGIWAIPSHHYYPADAQARLVNAATMFVGLNVVRVVSDNDSEHETFGVVEPSEKDTRLGDEGVGTLVNVFGQGEQGQTKLAALVIGKPVKGLNGQHYARLPGKSRVYQVRIDPSQLSTRFQDWIETDLLKLNPWDVARITIKDYSVHSQPTAQGFNISIERRMELTASTGENRWNLDLLREFKAADGDLVPASMDAGEELKADRLETLKNALGDLKIVDVERKPKGLGADLRADKEFLADNESQASLAERGFFALNGELLCTDGELAVDTQDGVRYLLRFGRIAGLGETNVTKSGDGEAGEESSINRYMFVSVQVNEDQFPNPELEPLPELTQNPANDDAASASDDPTAESEPTIDNELALEIDRIRKANQRKIDERNDKLETARARVSELQYRFADWYYIVSDDVFKKLRLRRDDLISFSEEALRAGTGLRAFRYLQRQGLRPRSNEADAGPPSGFAEPSRGD